VFHSAFILLVFLYNFIDFNTTCVNSAVNWTCPGGYLKVHNAQWTIVNPTVCSRTSNNFGNLDVTTYLQNQCDNRTFCDFTVSDTTFRVSCGKDCSGLNYAYECVSKSLVLPIFFIILSPIEQGNNRYDKRTVYYGNTI
jgi:hypothetical protein